MNWNGRRVTAAILLFLTVIIVAVYVGINIGRDYNPASNVTNNYNTTIGAASLPNNAAVTPANEVQRVMLGQFRLATNAEAALLQDLPDFKNDPAYQHIYVANQAEIILAPIKTAMVLILVEGQRWVSGPQSMVTILRAPALTKAGIGLMAVPFSDPLCDAERFGILKGDCLDSKLQKPGSWNEMIRNTRYPTEGELQTWLGDKYHKGQTKSYLVALRDLWIAPQYTFDGAEGYNGVIAIFVPQGVSLLGGQLGYMDVVPVGGTQYSTIVLDTMCFMNHISNATFAPVNFAPAPETKRVERCKR
ncbi:MAG TPA: hypothetical protein VM581_00475 [Magnetospirillaceae bacterium]|nr:hypothetical protein [Magnetospirillaceae bacterium]